MKKQVAVSILLTIELKPKAKLEEVLCEMDYDFKDKTGKATIESEILDWEVR